MSDKLPVRKSTSREVEAFLKTASKLSVIKSSSEHKGRLIFALDATASREHLWDIACHYQAEMFEQTAAIGSLDIQLCYYRGYHEFRVHPWTNCANELQREMGSVYCLAGRTQLARVLKHSIAETKQNKVASLVFIGDAMEESVDALGNLAGQLGLLNVPVFLFQEGRDNATSKAFAQFAKLSGGAHCYFDSGSAQQLKELLTAVAVYAVGGRKALEYFSRNKGRHLLALTRQL